MVSHLRLSFLLPPPKRLDVGISYGVRVSARNERGLGRPQFTTPAAAAPPPQKPDHPRSVSLQVDSDRSLRVLFTSPEDDGGAAVTKYKVSWLFVYEALHHVISYGLLLHSLQLSSKFVVDPTSS